MKTNQANTKPALLMPPMWVNGIRLPGGKPYLCESPNCEEPATTVLPNSAHACDQHAATQGAK